MTRQAHAVMMVVMLAALACGPAKGRNEDDSLADDDATTADDTRAGADGAADSGPADDAAPDVGETTADTVAADLTAGDLGPDADVSCPELWTRVPHDDAPATCELLPDPEAVSRATFRRADPIGGRALHQRRRQVSTSSSLQ